MLELHRESRVCHEKGYYLRQSSMSPFLPSRGKRRPRDSCEIGETGRRRNIRVSVSQGIDIGARNIEMRQSYGLLFEMLEIRRILQLNSVTSCCWMVTWNETDSNICELGEGRRGGSDRKAKYLESWMLPSSSADWDARACEVRWSGKVQDRSAHTVLLLERHRWRLKDKTLEMENFSKWNDLDDFGKKNLPDSKINSLLLIHFTLKSMQMTYSKQHSLSKCFTGIEIQPLQVGCLNCRCDQMGREDTESVRVEAIKCTGLPLALRPLCRIEFWAKMKEDDHLHVNPLIVQREQNYSKVLLQLWRFRAIQVIYYSHSLVST